MRDQRAVVLGRNMIQTESSKKIISSTGEFSEGPERDERAISERSAGQR